MSFKQKKKINVKKKALIALMSFLSFITLVIIVFLVWAQLYYKATDAALSNLNNNSSVAVDINDRNIIFKPSNHENLKKTGFIFYPGGKVDEKAYAYLGIDIAEEGFFTCIIGMPLRLAVLKPGAAQTIIDEYPHITNWIIGGHSLGGSMAANFAYNNQDIIDGLVLLASYPAGSNDLSSSPIKVVSLYGTNDGIINETSLQQSKNLLPYNAEFIPVKGGNHSQFGDYGLQDGDNPPDISTFEQNEIVSLNILQLLKDIEENR